MIIVCRHGSSGIIDVTRESIKSENQCDESLKITFIDEMKVLASELCDSDDAEYQRIAEL